MLKKLTIDPCPEWSFYQSDVEASWKEVWWCNILYSPVWQKTEFNLDLEMLLSGHIPLPLCVCFLCVCAYGCMLRIMLVNTESVFCAADDKDNHRETGGGEKMGERNVWSREFHKEFLHLTFSDHTDTTMCNYNKRHAALYQHLYSHFTTVCHSKWDLLR